jgi:hypothetical protein
MLSYVLYIVTNPNPLHIFTEWIQKNKLRIRNVTFLHRHNSINAIQQLSQDVAIEPVRLGLGWIWRTEGEAFCREKVLEVPSITGVTGCTWPNVNIIRGPDIIDILGRLTC